MTDQSLNTEWLTWDAEPLTGLAVAIWWATNMVFWTSILLVPAALVQGNLSLALGSAGAVVASSWVWMRQSG